MTDDEREPHPGGMGYARCLPDPRWDDNEFVQNMGYALVGLVPFRISELRNKGAAELQALAIEASQTIAAKGDIFQYQKNSRRGGGHPSGVLSALATAYAVLALSTPDSGVTFFAFHACYWPHQGCPQD